MVRSVQIGTADPNTMRTHAANAPRAIRIAFRDRAQGRAIGRPRLLPPQLKLASERVLVCPTELSNGLPALP